MEATTRPARRQRGRCGDRPGSGWVRAERERGAGPGARSTSCSLQAVKHCWPMTEWNDIQALQWCLMHGWYTMLMHAAFDDVPELLLGFLVQTAYAEASMWVAVRGETEPSMLQIREKTYLYVVAKLDATSAGSARAWISILAVRRSPKCTSTKSAGWALALSSGVSVTSLWANLPRAQLPPLSPSSAVSGSPANTSGMPASRRDRWSSAVPVYPTLLSGLHVSAADKRLAVVMVRQSYPYLGAHPHGVAAVLEAVVAACATLDHPWDRICPATGGQGRFPAW
eukprot:scaffold2134_cov384-Prasinococcus_capsulatus_cf.AAC.11